MDKRIGHCKNNQNCFFVKDYFMCGHLMCYNLAIKLLCCIQCGDRRLRYHMNGNREEVVMRTASWTRSVNAVVSA